tara:strand:- start:1429 stop:1605 length:177 start_codon:yes stop_codon:yes gene_type:complete
LFQPDLITQVQEDTSQRIQNLLSVSIVPTIIISAKTYNFKAFSVLPKKDLGVTRHFIH